MGKWFKSGSPWMFGMTIGHGVMGKSNLWGLSHG